MPNVVQVWDAELGYSHASLQSRPPGGPAQVDPRRMGGADPLWGIWAVNSGGGTGVIIFPHSTLEWRSAEYGIDPEDLDTILDVILHVGAAPDPDDPLVYQDSARLRVLQETSDLPDVWTPGVPDRERLASVKERVRLVKTHILRVEAAPRADRQAALDYVGSPRIAPADPLAPITDVARLDPIRVASKRAYLEWRRAQESGRPVTPHFGLKPPHTFLSGAAVP